MLTEHELMPETAEHVASSHRRRTSICLVVTFLACAAVIVHSLLTDIPLNNSKETTYISSPLKSDGKQVDYFAAWEREVYPPEIATQANGFRLIVEHLGAARNCTPAQFAEICRKLGVDNPSSVPEIKFEGPRAFVDAHCADLEDSFEEARKRTSRLSAPWTLNDLPVMESWLVENGPAIDLIGKAVGKPVFSIPLARTTEDESLFGSLVPEIYRVLSFVRALETRANYRIGTGDLDGAIDDIVACKRLGRHVGKDGNSIEMGLGRAFESVADSIPIAGSLEHGPTDEQLSRLVKEFNELPAASQPQKANLFERYIALDAVQSLAHGKNTFAGIGVPEDAPRRGIDWNVVARRINSHHDAAAKGVEMLPPTRNRSREFFSRKVRSELLGDMLGSLFCPSNEAFQEGSHRGTCRDRIHCLSLAMLRYESAHGTLPPAYTADADGTPLHSWRVLLLPYLGQQMLHDKIRHDEPWNSPHNQKLHEESVAFYQCPSATLPLGQTTYAVVVGHEMPFEAAEAKKLADIGDNNAAMILIVERRSPVCWMDPTRDVLQRVVLSLFFVNGPISRETSRKMTW